MTRHSPLDDPASAAFAWGRWKRMMQVMGIATAITVAAILGYMWFSETAMSIHFYIAVGLGVGASMMLMGALMGMNHFPVDLPRLVDFYLRGLLDLDTIIAERIPLEAVNEGFNTMRAGHSARTVVVFD